MKLVTTALLLTALMAAPVCAKLPPPSDADKAKAAEAAAKTAWSDKVAAFQLCRAMDRSVEYYRKSAKAAGREAPAPIATPACTDPGAFVPPPPLEASGAHSPATTATAPPSSKDAAAEQHGQPKK